MKNFHTMFFRKKHGIKKTLLIVNLSLILSVACSALTLSTASAQSNQNKIYTLKCKDQTVESIFEQLEKQGGYNFLYQSSDIKNLKKVTRDFIKVPLTEIVSNCLKDSGLAFEIVNRQVVIFPASKVKEAKEQITITGKVTNSKGEPLIGANILIRGTFKGTATDLNGCYSIEVPENAVLIFRFIGHKTKEVSASGKTVINVVMEEEAAELMETTFISTGYQKIKPEQSTGSLATIRARDFDTRVNTTDILKGLENKIPGLLINNDIQFEGNSLFQIRGISTINGNKQPLIVMDGYPTELSIDMINPNEIESVTVLKDAAAATIYGVRASNGVIVIERKKALAGKPHVSFRGTVGLTPKENYDRYRWDKDGSNTVINYDRASYKNSGSPNLWLYLIDPIYGSSFNYTPTMIILAKQTAGVITEEEANQELETLGSYNNTKDYSRLFLRNAFTQTYNLDISGGDRNALYFITTNFTRNDLSKINNGNNQFSLSGRLTLNLSKRFSLDITTDFQEDNESSVPVPDINNIYPYERFQDNNGNPLSLYNGSYVNPYYNDYLTSIGLLDNMYYPLVDINEINNETHSLTNRITANFRYNIGKGFNLSFGGVYETSSTKTKHLASENSSEVHQYINLYATDGSNGLIFNLPQGSFLRQQTANLVSYTFRTQLHYDKQLGKDHSLNAILGTEVRDVLNKSNIASYFGYNDQTLSHHPVDNNTLFGTYFNSTYAPRNPTLSYSSLFSQGYEDNRYVSAYSNLAYTWKGKYSFTGSIRIDQSNLFGTDPKYHYKPLWSLGGAWNIHKEDFMKEVHWVESLKLRIAYGFNGNVAKNALPQIIAVADINGYDNTIPTLRPLSLANSGLRWEQTRNFNIGVDYNILKNITGSIDYYNRVSTDLLATNQIDASKGENSALVNNASVRNKGLEVNLSADWITRSYFNWNTGFVFSHNASKVLQVYNTIIAPTSSSTAYIYGADYLEGYAVGAMFCYRYAGLDNTGSPLIYDTDGNTKHFYENDKGKEDVDYVGSSVPTFNAGLSNRLDIGNFYVYCMINYYGGFNIRVPVPYAGDIRPLKGANNYWRSPGDEVNHDILPSPLSSYITDLLYTDKYTVNGDYFTLGDLTVSYSFRNKETFKKIGITNFEVRLQASNVYTVALNKYNYSVATGNYAKSYLTPTYTIGLYVNL
jgi:TonB-linked SusC/RagA family outer membrane protein